ncbi:hypothetical protein BKA93DRAFT_750695 [Sparassis latifolia]
MTAPLLRIGAPAGPSMLPKHARPAVRLCRQYRTASVRRCRISNSAAARTHARTGWHSQEDWLCGDDCDEVPDPIRRSVLDDVNDTTRGVLVLVLGEERINDAWLFDLRWDGAVGRISGTARTAPRVRSRIRFSGRGRTEDVNECMTQMIEGCRRCAGEMLEFEGIGRRSMYARALTLRKWKTERWNALRATLKLGRAMAWVV